MQREVELAASTMSAAYDVYKLAGSGCLHSGHFGSLDSLTKSLSDIKTDDDPCRPPFYQLKPQNTEEGTINTTAQCLTPAQKDARDLRP